jgi:hypothetical protein
MSRRFQRDLQGAVDFIQAPGPLKEAVKKLYRTHCKETLDTASIDEEVLSEYDRQREFLEKNVDTLKHKLHAEVHKHKAANSKAMLVSCCKIGQPGVMLGFSLHSGQKL